MTWILIVVFYGTGFSAEFVSKEACEKARVFVQANALVGVAKAVCIKKEME